MKSAHDSHMPLPARNNVKLADNQPLRREDLTDEQYQAVSNVFTVITRLKAKLDLKNLAA